MKQLNLKTLIIGAVTLTLLLTVIVNMFATNALNKTILTNTSLETNRVYAQKLASTTERYIEETFHTLAFSANYLQHYMDDEEQLIAEAERIRTQNRMFNSVLVMDAKGLVLGVSPPSIELKGQVLTSSGPSEALHSRTPLISKPYEGVTGRLIIFISYPIFNEVGDYIGLVGGTIYIKENNVLHEVLGQHYYDDGSYVYVVDSDGRIIYHKDSTRLNDLVSDNLVVQKVIAGEAGAAQVQNSHGIEMFAGYSPIAYANWGVVSQRPVAAALAPIQQLNERQLLMSLPFFLLVLAVCLYFAYKIAQPINRMAVITAQSTKADAVQSLSYVPTWYYETNVLKATLLKTLSALHGEVTFFRQQSTTDALTGLMNRRVLEEQLAQLDAAKTPYTLTVIDIDHFKSVNDTYGHHVGDEVLQFVANTLVTHMPTTMHCCRFGGEEFVLLSPQATAGDALPYVEQLRQVFAATNSPCGRPITISAGIAQFPADGTNAKLIFQQADAALYRAKENGRNRIEVAST